MAFADSAWRDLGWRVAPESGPPSMVAGAGGAFVTWTDATGPHIARVSRTGLKDLALPAADVAPHLAVDADGLLTAAWLDAEGTGRIARWDGAAWKEIAGPWVEAATGGDAPRVAWWEGRVPVVAWREDGRVRIALYNGPVGPGGDR
jgi:hypothetical protein